jgi:hypothetical protein
MSLFRFPKGLVDDLHRFSARFWWGSDDGRQKIHWGSWNKLCVSKMAGGLDFRDLSIFNKSLLAKQCWRLLCNPLSLAARVLKQCYFPDSSLLQADCKSSSSFLWKSFVWGRELIAAGSRWRIGSGASVLIYQDRWIPRPSTFKVISPPLLGEAATVQMLKNPSGSWNSELIREFFLPEMLI